tara:strand:- start:1817 stop:3124 length:1308 start_codon:yes stop_codon:yes gene_type:complete
LNINKNKINEVYKLGKKVFPICRSITGKGTVETLKEFKKFYKNLNIRKIKSGSKVFDWKVPPEWNIEDAFVIDKNNQKIIDFKKNNLHIVNYSVPLKKKLNTVELLKNLYTNIFRPNAIPYVTSYYKKNWGFCVTEKFKQEIKKKYKKDDIFKVVINSSLNSNGNLAYGEIFIPGKSKKEILISSYVCHPSMANNELSGPMISLLIADYFKKIKNRYSLRIILIPETIGSIAYISKNLKKLKKNFLAGYNLSCVGDDRNYSYIPSKYKNALCDRVIYKICKKLKINFKEYSFLERGSDERQYNSPGIDLPVGCVMRTKFGEFPEYHTSDDNFDLVTKKGLRDSLKLILECISYLMESKFPVSTTKCEPFLSKRNLYPTIGNRQNNFTDNQELSHFLQYADGQNNLEDISKLINLSYKKTFKISDVLKKNKLIRFI